MVGLKQRILPAARKLRPLVPLNREYAARSILYRCIPVKERAQLGSVFHCCTWKTASQWVRLVLTDPRIYRYGGLTVDLLGEYDGEVFRHLDRPLTGPRLATPLYGTPDQFDAVRRPDERYRAFFVLRDPRDLLVSWYFSNLYSHPTNPIVAERRAQLATMDTEAGLRHQLETELASVFDMLCAWAERSETDDHIRLVHYEDLTGPDTDHHWTELFDHCGMPVPDQIRRDVLATYAFRNLTGGRPAASEDVQAKYRKGTAGDWRAHFTPELEATFETRFPGLVTRLGYEA